MPFGHLPGHGQAEADPLGLCRLKRFAQPLRDFRGQAGAIIEHAQPDVLSIGKDLNAHPALFADGLEPR